MKELRQALRPIKCDAAKVFCVDRARDAVWDDRATSTGTHDGDDYIARVDRVALQGRVLLIRDKAPGSPPKLIVHGIVDAEDRNA